MINFIDRVLKNLFGIGEPDRVYTTEYRRHCPMCGSVALHFKKSTKYGLRQFCYSCDHIWYLIPYEEFVSLDTKQEGKRC